MAWNQANAIKCVQRWNEGRLQKVELIYNVSRRAFSSLVRKKQNKSSFSVLAFDEESSTARNVTGLLFPGLHECSLFHVKFCAMTGFPVRSVNKIRTVDSFSCYTNTTIDVYASSPQGFYSILRKNHSALLKPSATETNQLFCGLSIYSIAILAARSDTHLKLTNNENVNEAKLYIQKIGFTYLTGAVCHH